MGKIITWAHFRKSQKVVNHSTLIWRGGGAEKHVGMITSNAEINLPPSLKSSQQKVRLPTDSIFASHLQQIETLGCYTHTHTPPHTPTHPHTHTHTHTHTPPHSSISSSCSLSFFFFLYFCPVFPPPQCFYSLIFSLMFTH